METRGRASGRLPVLLAALLGCLLVEASLASEPPSAYLSTESLMPPNPVLGQPTRIGLALSFGDRRSAIPYTDLELFFLHSRPATETRWELGLRGGLSVALADDAQRRCCELDNQEGSVGAALRLARRSGSAGVELEHRVGHRGVQGAYEAYRDSTMDWVLARVRRDMAAGLAVEVAAAAFLRDEPRDRPGFWQVGLFETSGRVRLAAGVQAGLSDRILESARVRLSFWRGESCALILVPYVTAEYGDPRFSARPPERDFRLLVGVELPLALSNRPR